MIMVLPPPCDELTARGVSGAAADPGSGTMVATILASSLAVTVASIITVALPSMQRDLGADSAGLQWIINAYLLPMSALVLLGGALGDRLGRKRFFILGLVIFALATLGCACAPNLALMLAARFVQGVGAALIVPNSLALLADAYSGKRRGRAVGTWAAASTIAGAAAPLLGGVVVDHADWRWSFAIVIPAAAAALLMAMQSIPADVSPPQRVPLDLAGGALAVVSLGNLVVSLTYLPHSGTSNPVVIGTAGVGLMSLVAFLCVERRKKADAIMPLGIFSSGSFSGISILTLLLYCALGGFMVLLPLFFMNGLGYSATQAGFALLPLPLVMGTLSRPLGGLATKWGVRRTLSLGPVAVAIGFALIATLREERVSYWLDIFPGLVTISLGMALTVAPLTTAVMNAVENRFVGVASGLNNAISRTAGLIATSLLGLVLPSANTDKSALLNGLVHASWVGCALAMAAAVTSFAKIREEEVNSDLNGNSR